MEDLERGFINKKKILEYVSEEQIFELVFGFEPVECEYVESPFRDDRNPGCWFQYCPSGKLRFVDFANSSVINGIKMNNIDCFDAVQVYFKLGNFYKTLDFIKTKLIDGKNIKADILHIKPKKRKPQGVTIKIRPVAFAEKDKRYWQKYGISSNNLVEDGVFSVGSYEMLNTKHGNIKKRIYSKELCYAYTEFFDIDGNLIKGKKKLYRPLKKGRGKFLTNCGSDDIGSLETIRDNELLIISKSYKDCRVLRNEGYNCIWLQNEGMIPSAKILTYIGKKVDKIIVFFDNDEAGIKASHKVKDEINKFFPNKASVLYLPIEYNTKYKVSDPSDMYHKMGSMNLKQFLKNNI